MALLKETSVVFLSGVRTGFGSFGGTLKDLSATELGAIAGRAALERSGIEPAAVDHVVFGNVLQTSADAPYLARHIGLQAGLPVEIPALTVNRLCGSGFEAVIQGAADPPRQLEGGAGRRHRIDEPGASRGSRRPVGITLWPGAPLEDTLFEALRDSNCGLSMAETAEKLAEQYPGAARGRGLLRGTEPGPGQGRVGRRRLRRRGSSRHHPEPQDATDRVVGGRRAHAPRDDARSAREAATLFQEGRRGDRGERLGNLRRCRGADRRG